MSKNLIQKPKLNRGIEKRPEHIFYETRNQPL